MLLLTSKWRIACKENACLDIWHDIKIEIF